MPETTYQVVKLTPSHYIQKTRPEIHQGIQQYPETFGLKYCFQVKTHGQVDFAVGPAVNAES